MSLPDKMRALSLPALGALLIGLVLTLLLFLYTQRNADNENQRGFSQRTELAQSAFRRVNEDIFAKLLSIRNLVQSRLFGAEELQRSISPEGHRHFSSGLQYVGFIRVESDQNVQCEPFHLDMACLNTLTIYPRATNDAIFKNGVLNTRSRVEAIGRAIDTGYFATTAPLSFASDNVAEPGVLAFLSVYEANASLDSIESRRKALTGIAVASYSLEFLLRAELGRDFFNQTAMRIEDHGMVRNLTGSDRVVNPIVLMNSLAMMREASPDHASSAPTFTVEEQVGGRVWSLQFTDIGLSARKPTLAPAIIVFLLGSLLSVFLASFIQNIVGARARAEALAHDRSTRLKDRDAQLSQALTAARMGGWQWQTETGEFWQDPFADTLINPVNGELTHLFDSFDPRDLPVARRALGLAITEGIPMHFEARLIKPTQDVHWVAVTARLTFNEAAEVTSAAGLIRDITDRVELTSARQQLVSKLVIAEEEVRRNIARELHDQLGQEITALIFGLKNLEGLPANSNAYEDLFGKLRQIMHDIDSRVDKFMLDLRPVVLDDLGLSAALQTQFAQWTDLHKITVHAHLDKLDQVELPFEVATTAFRVVQESLTNVAKHSNATAVDVIVEVKSDELRIVIEDNGDGASIEPSPNRHGLIGIRERVESLGGECRYESSTGNGFSVFVKLPVLQAAIKQSAMVSAQV